MVRKMMNNINIFKHTVLTDNRSIIVNTSQLALALSQIMVFIIFNCSISTECKVYQLPIKTLSIIPQCPFTLPSPCHQCPLNVQSASTQPAITHHSTRNHKTVLTTYSHTTMDAYKLLFGYNSVYEPTIIIHYNTHAHSKSHKTSEKVLCDPTSVMLLSYG